MKTSELTGGALDWAVALIEYPEWKEQGFLEVFPHDLSFDDGTVYAPSIDWAQGGLIIEREKIAIDWDHDCWNASTDSHPAYYSAETPLVAAMRCYVASKLGDEVDVPEELK